MYTGQPKHFLKSILMKGTFGLTFKERVYGTRQDKKDLERHPRKNTKTIGIQSCPVWVGDAILHLLILDEMLHMNKTSKLLLEKKAGGLVRWDSLDLPSLSQAPQHGWIPTIFT